MNPTIRRGQWVTITWGSYTHEVKFIRWLRMKRHNGGPDTNQFAVGAVVWSDWMFHAPLFSSRQRDYLPAGYYPVRPYHDLYLKVDNLLVEVKRPALTKAIKGIRNEDRRKHMRRVRRTRR